MIIPVIFKSYHAETPNKGYWDYGWWENLFAGKERTIPGVTFAQYDSFSELFSVRDPLNEGMGAIVVIPGRTHAKDIELLNKDLQNLAWVVLIVLGDEERLFNTKQVKHPNMRIWLMNPRPGVDKYDTGVGEMLPPDAHERLFQASAYRKSLDWFFAGQITHERRQRAATAIWDMLAHTNKGKYVPTPGFTQGLSREEYYENMSKAITVPCPSGPFTPGSFRVFEALEAGAVPIVDDRTPDPEYPRGYWKNLLGADVPFPIIEADDFEQLPGYTKDVVDVFPVKNNRVYAWWQQYKRDLVYKLFADVTELGHFDYIPGSITVLVVTSPIKSHPSAEVITTTLKSIRAVLPDAEILIGIDGVRPEQESRRADYEEYIRRLLVECNFDFKNVTPYVFDEHLHQAEMTRRLLEKVQTPTVLFVEHDTPLTPDQEFPWNSLIECIESGDANVIRFHFESKIPDPHKGLMIGEVETIHDVPLLKTFQWSQRPHLASTAFYRALIKHHFSQNSRTMIEDVIHGKLYESFAVDGEMGWNLWRVWIYAPPGNIKRSYHLDGRDGEAKYSMKV